MQNNFLQSRQWEEFQSSCGFDTKRIDDNLVIKFSLPFGKSYLCCFYPRLNEKNIKNFLSECRKYAKKENCVFLHIEIDNQQNIKIFEHLNKMPIKLSDCRQPQHSLVIDLAKSESEILTQMHHKTRYNINLAQKKGVKISISDHIDDINIFYNIAKETEGRGEFHFHSKEYYKQMMEILGKKYKMIDLLIAKYENKPIAAIIVLYYEKQAYYLHGASSNKDRNLMAPYLLQWTAIQEAIKRGCETYDFWGTSLLMQEARNPCLAGRQAKFEIRDKSEIKNSNDQNNQVSNRKLKIIDDNHPWSGITRFKLGFAPTGKYIVKPDACEIIYDKVFYSAYKMYKMIKRTK